MQILRNIFQNIFRHSSEVTKEPAESKILSFHRKKNPPTRPVNEELASRVNSFSPLIIPEGSGIDFAGRQGRVIFVTGNYSKDFLHQNYQANGKKVLIAWGDNIADHNKKPGESRALGGQAAICAFEPNAIGFPTMHAGGKVFSPEDFDIAAKAIDSAVKEIPDDAILVVPISKGEDSQINIGTGYANLPEQAPLIYNYIKQKIELLSQPVPEKLLEANKLVRASDSIPKMHLSDSFLEIGNHFMTKITLPEGIELSPDAELFVVNDYREKALADIPFVRQPILFSKNNKGEHTILVESNQPIPDFLDRNEDQLTTFEVQVRDKGEIVAHAEMRAGDSILPSDQKKFLTKVLAELSFNGKKNVFKDEPFRYEYRKSPNSEASIIVSRSNSKEDSKYREEGSNGITVRTFHPDGKPSKIWHLTDRMQGISDKWGAVGFEYDSDGKRKGEDNLLGSRHGPNFRSASEVIKFLISSKFYADQITIPQIEAQQKEASFLLN